MEDKDMDLLFDQLKYELPVNHTLKHKLRKSFKTPGMNILLKSMIAVAMIAIIISIGLMVPSGNNIVNAASIRIVNHTSLINLGSGDNLGISEWKGTLYVPIIGKGLFAYNQNGFQKIHDQEANYVRVSSDGKQIVYSTGGTVSILDIASGDAKELLKSDESAGVYYEEPSWSYDQKKIIYVKRVIESNATHGFTVKESGIFELDLETTSSKKLSDGSYPSYINHSDFILYEDQGKVIKKNLQTKTEEIIDNGRFPSAAPDGNLVAYVKPQEEQLKQFTGKNAAIKATLDDIWIANTEDSTIKKKLTSNYPYYFTDEEEWLENLQPSDIPQELSLSGAYSYYDPVWSSDSKSLYALKNSNINAGNGMSLICIDLSKDRLSAEDTVKNYIQALIMRDEDYAKGLLAPSMDMPQTLSNPHQVGYSILSTGKENGKDFVEAEIYWQYTASSYFEIEQVKIYLIPSSEGFLIDSIVNLSKTTVYEKEGTIFINDGAQKEVLRMSEIPMEFTSPGYSQKVASLVYDEDKQVLVMGVLTFNDMGDSTSLKLMRYNMPTKSFELIDNLQVTQGSIGISSLTMDSGNKYLTADLFYQDQANIRTSTLVYNLETLQKTELNALFKNTVIDVIHSSYWSGEKLVFNVTGNDQTMSFLLKPEPVPTLETLPVQ